MAEKNNFQPKSNPTITVKISKKVTATIYSRDRVIERRDSIIAFQRKNK